MQKLLLFLVIWTLWVVFPTGSIEAKAETYTINPTSDTYNHKFESYPTYNSHTKHYYLLRSYLEQLEKINGGTLIIEKGTYTVSNVLFVPSNVTVKLEDGAKLVNSDKTGTSELDADKSLFHLIRPSLGKEEGVYGKHEGEKNISFIGAGTATMDLNFDKDAIAIIAGHNKNLKIENIHFTNMYSGHFIEIDATQNAVISNNKFTNSKASPTEIKEAINIDTPDKLTNGWSSAWSKFDKTPNNNMLIENNVFYDLDRAIGTHKYSGGKYHENIVIRNNKIEKMRQDAIRVMNWRNSTIEYNIIKNVDPGEYNSNRGIMASGALNPTFQNNVFIDLPRAIQFIAWKNDDSGSEYDITYNKLTENNKEVLSTNIVFNSEEDFIRINPKFKKYDAAHTDFIPLKTTLPPALPKVSTLTPKIWSLIEQNNDDNGSNNSSTFYEDLFTAESLPISFQNYRSIYELNMPNKLEKFK